MPCCTGRSGPFFAFRRGFFERLFFVSERTESLRSGRNPAEARSLHALVPFFSNTCQHSHLFSWCERLSCGRAISHRISCCAGFHAVLCCAVLGERISPKGRARFSQMGQSSAGIRAVPPVPAELRVSKVLRRCQGRPSFVGGYARLAVTAASCLSRRHLWLSVYATTSKLECPLNRVRHEPELRVSRIMTVNRGLP